MPGNVYPMQATFSRGEGTPYLHARTDTDHFRMMLVECRNFIVLPYGGVERRSGSRHVAEVKFSDKVTRLIEFAFSVAQTYVIELGDYYARLYSNGGRVEDPPGTPVEVVTPWSADQVMALDYASARDVLYMFHASVAPQELVRSDEVTWTIEDHVTIDGPYMPADDTRGTLQVAGTGDVVEIMTTNTGTFGTVSSDTASAIAWRAFTRSPNNQYTSAGVSGWLKYAGSVAAVCTNYTVRGAKSDGALSPASWVFEGSNDDVNWTVLDTVQNETGWVREEFRHYEISNTDAYLYYRFRWFSVDSNLTSTEISELRFKHQASDAVYSTTISKLDGVNGGAGFLASDIGRLLRIQGSDGFWRWGRIVARTAADDVDVEWHGPVSISNDNPLTGDPTPHWRIGSWCDENGYPARVNLFKDRLYSARTNAEPSTVWGSHSLAPRTHSSETPLLATDAINVNVLGDKAGEIQWLSENRRDLLFSTEGAQRRITQADLSEGLSATNIDQGLETTHKAGAIRPVQAGGVTLMVDLAGTMLREFGLQPQSEQYHAPNLTIMSEHLLRPGVTGMAHQHDPYSLVWVSVADGSMAGLTYEPDQLISGLAKHTMGGSFGSDAHGHVVSNAVRSNGSGRDEHWMIVKRTIDGSTKQYVEYLAPRFEDDAPLYGEFFDSSMRYDGVPATSISGADHLVGETVGVLADGVDIGDAIVDAAGGFDLPLGIEASVVTYGLRYTSRIKTLRMPNHGNQDGSGMGRARVVVGAAADLYKTGYLNMGTTLRQEPLTLRKTDELLGSQVTLREGMHEIVGIDDTHGGEGQIVADTDKGLPATIRAVRLILQGAP